jgi:hypothetical protein
MTKPVPLRRNNTFVAEYTASSGSSRFSSISKSVFRMTSATPSSRDPSAVCSFQDCLSPLREADLLQAPMIDTPEPLAKFETPLNVTTNDWLAFNKSCDSPPEASERTWGTTTTRALDYLDLMICHQDFPRLVEISTKARAANVEMSVVSDVAVAIERMNTRFAGSGKNLTIERGQYHCTDRSMDFRFMKLNQHLETQQTSSIRSPPYTKNPSIRNWEIFKETKRDTLMKATFGDNKKTIRIDDLQLLSEQTGVAVADIVSYVKSRGRKEVKLSLLPKLMQKTKETVYMEGPPVDCNRFLPLASSTPNKFQPTSAWLSRHLVAMAEKSTPVPKSCEPRSKTTGSKSRNAKSGGISPTIKVCFGKAYRAPSRSPHWHRTLSTALAKTHKSRSPTRYNAIRYLLEEPSTKVSEKRRWSSQATAVTDRAVVLDPSTTKKPRRDIPTFSLNIRNGNATPLSDLSLRSSMSHSVDTSFLQRVGAFSETPLGDKSFPYSSPSIFSQGAMDSATWESFDQCYSSLFCLNGIKEEHDNCDRIKVREPGYKDTLIEEAEVRSCPAGETTDEIIINKRLFSDNDEDLLSDTEHVSKTMAFQFV